MKTELTVTNEQRINQFAAELQRFPTPELPLVHRFTPGLYVREIFMPKGAWVVSLKHLTEHPFVISKGHISVFTDGKIERLKAPFCGITKAGTQRVLFVHEDCVFTTFHVTSETDPNTIVEQVTEKPPFGEILALKDIEEMKQPEAVVAQQEQQQQTMAWVAGIGIAASIGETAYNASNQPSQPNLAASSAALSNAEASMLPTERSLAAAAQTGGTVINPGYTVSTQGGQQAQQIKNQIAELQGQVGQKTPASFNNSPGNATAQTPEQLADINSQIAALQNQLAAIPPGGGNVYLNSQGQVVPESQAVTDFGQFGGAQTQATIAEQNAKDQLALEQQYDPAFISTALQQEQLADPNSVAARQAESALIQKQIQQPITNPVAPVLEQQIGSQVAAGKGLDSFDQGVLDNATGEALKARGGSTVPADFTSPLTTGAAGNQRQAAGIQTGQQFLSSGTTPEDIQYRQNQQNLANLSAEISGQTPTSEFSSLSNAGHGPNPVSSGPALPTLQDTLPTAASAALTTQQQQTGQANNWMAGLSTVLNATGALGAITNNTGVK